jgi:hypothetical protein
MIGRILVACAALAVAPHLAGADDAPPAAPQAEPANPPASAPAAEARPTGPTGTIKGRVVDGATQDPLPGATIQVRGGGAGDQTIAADIEGGYTLSLAPGTYTVVVFTPDYVEQRRTVTVAEATEQAIDIALPPVPRVSKGEVVKVYSGLDTRRDSAVLAERRLAATVSDAVSAQQIARSPDSNAADVAKRMVAATVQDNRYVVIRGLGGRYSTTLLNGVPLPSPDPDVPAAPLDLFPSGLVNNLTVNKTFSPDMPGNFAGGALGIETRNYPTKFLFKAKVGVGSNSTSSFRTINGQSGGNLDVLGFDDGGRALPSVIPTNSAAGADGLSPEQRNAQIAAFKNNWAITRGTAGPSLSVGATIGDTFELSDQRLGYFGNLSFGHGYSARTARIARVGGDDGAGGRAPSMLQLDDRQGSEQANLGAVGAVGWKPASGHKLDLFTLYAHTGDVSASEVTGTDNTSTIIDRTRLQFLQRELLFAQLVGDDRLADKVILEWQANVARVAQYEPDTRDLQRTRVPDGRMAISTSAGGSERLFGELADTTLGGAAAIRVPLDDVKLKLGGSFQRSARESRTRRFRFNLAGDAAFLSPQEAFAPENAGSRMSMFEVTSPSDGYAATRTVAAAYALADVNVTPALRLVGGARFELADLEVRLDSAIDPAVRAMAPTTHNDRDLLPALNVVYAVTTDTNLRAAFTTTVARANFREIAPALYYDYVRRRVISGNPGLVETKIQNADLRWERFLGDSELVAASLFGKRFSSPIERTVESAGDGDNVSFINAPTATSYGLELEARLSLGRLTPALAAFSAAGNFSLIGSRIDLGGGFRRPLQGQSPYVVNLGLGYEHAGLGTRVDLAYNTFGRRIEETGTGGAGNIYEEAFHRLDLTIAQPLPSRLRLKLTGNNLLNQRVVRTQDDVDILAYQTGVSIVGSVEYSID